jgi:probable HAF family extracellular repeat protein
MVPMLIAYLWNNDTPTTLGSLPGGVSSSAFRINEVGHSAGVIYLDPSVDANIPVRFDGTTATPLQVFGGGTQMYGTTAYAINNQDVLVGETWSEKFLYIRPVRWDGTAITDLGTLGGRYGSAVAINDSGQIHGLSNTAFDEAIHATLWDNGAIIDLGTLGGSTSSINDNNNLAQAVGASMIEGDKTWRATLWNGTTITELPSLGGTGTFAMATSINNLGDIVGQVENGHATLWKDGQVIDLNDFLPADLVAAGWILNNAGDINDDGVIVGGAFNPLNGDAIASFKLTPTTVPVPGAVWLFVSALAGMISFKQHKTMKTV